MSPEALRKMVVTPGGTTAAGLAAMEEHKTALGLIAAVEAGAKRGQEMAKEATEPNASSDPTTDRGRR
jgi:pyrroline-5-carboxylate reductase